MNREAIPNEGTREVADIEIDAATTAGEMRTAISGAARAGAIGSVVANFAGVDDSVATNSGRVGRR